MSKCAGIKSALFWGYFTDHCKKAKLGNHRIFHVTMAAAEFFPLLSQVVSMIEFLYLKAHQNKNSSKPSIKPSSTSQSTPTKIKTQEQAKKSLTHPTTSPTNSSNNTPTKASSSSTAKESSSTSLSSDDSSIDSGTHSTTSSDSKPKLVLGTKQPSKNVLKYTMHIDPYLYDGTGAKDLKAAIIGNDIDEVKKLLSETPKEPINQRIDGFSLLEWAAQNGHLEMVTLLVESGAKDAIARAALGGDIEFWDLARPSTSALLVAALNGHIDVVKYLLDNGAQDQVFSDYSSVLPRVVNTGNLKMVKLLVSYQHNSQDIAFSNAQHKAYYCDHADIYKFLLAQGVNFLQKTSEELLVDAAWLNKPNFVKMLIKSGLNIDAQDPETGCSLLHYAARARNDVLVSWLLAKGANPQLKTTADYEMGRYPSGAKAVIQKNTDYQTFAKYVLDFRAQTSLTAILCYSKANFSRSSFKDLNDCLSCIIDINAKHEEGNTFLHLAATNPSKFHLECFTALIGQGATIQENDDGKTPYDYIESTIQRLKPILLTNLSKSQADEVSEMIDELQKLQANAS